MTGGKANGRIWMERARLRKPSVSQGENTRPGDRVFLAAAAKCLPPMPLLCTRCWALRWSPAGHGCEGQSLLVAGAVARAPAFRHLQHFELVFGVRAEKHLGDFCGLRVTRRSRLE